MDKLINSERLKKKWKTVEKIVKYIKPKIPYNGSCILEFLKNKFVNLPMPMTEKNKNNE